MHTFQPGVKIMLKIFGHKPVNGQSVNSYIKFASLLCSLEESKLMQLEPSQ